jgi:hypothetical protein
MNGKKQNHLTLPEPVNYVQRLFDHPNLQTALALVHKMRGFITDNFGLLSISSCSHASCWSSPSERNRVENEKARHSGYWPLILQSAQFTKPQEKFEGIRDPDMLAPSRRNRIREHVLTLSLVAFGMLMAVLVV